MRDDSRLVTWETHPYDFVQTFPRERPWLRKIIRIAIEAAIVTAVLVAMLTAWASVQP